MLSEKFGHQFDGPLSPIAKRIPVTPNFLTVAGFLISVAAAFVIPFQIKLGGILILFAVTLPTLLWADISRPIIWLVLGATLGFFAIGFADDYLKFVKAQSKGMTPRQKFTAQVSVPLAVALVLYFLPGYSTKLSVPFFKSFMPDLGWFYVAFAVLVIA